MELNTISGLAIAGVICSAVLSMGVPIALFIAGRVKLKYQIIMALQNYGALGIKMFLNLLKKNKWKLTDSLKEKIVELAQKDAQDNVYMGRIKKKIL